MLTEDLKDQIQRLNDIGIALSSETKLDRLLDLIVRELRGFTLADAGSLYIRDGDDLQFEVAQNDTLQARQGADAESFRPFPLPLTKKSIAGFVALTGETLNIKDVYGLDDSVEFSFNQDFDKRNDYRTKSMLVVPMFDHRKGIIGVLQLINALDSKGDVVPFSQDVESLVLSLASQAAVAIRNAQLIASIKNLFAALVQYSASAIDARSPHTAGHSRRVASLALLAAAAIDRQTQGPFAETCFSEEELEELSYAAWLHDIGKIGVREWILEKFDKLNPTRMDLIRSRFDQIGQGFQLEHQRRLLDFYEAGRRPGPEEIAVLASERDRRLEQLRDDLDFLIKINTPGWMSDEDLARLDEIAAKEFTGGDGEEIRYLTDFEYKNLSIRKGNLTDEEYREIQSHVTYTYNIIKQIPFTPELSRIPDFAVAHHEMLNGTGYPKGLKAENIPLQARILGVVDIFDALVARDRPYKKAMPVEKALFILQDEAKVGRLDPDIVALFVKEKLWTDETFEGLNARPEDAPTLS
ncbi:MAG: HD domain-containing phosphohydrolase [Thermodesulfobacteriota bacterium]|nr:HD domain-containing phosphohydrolase [Thermodesulfobacteriota bacterium]